jgi:hypothetical protein
MGWQADVENTKHYREYLRSMHEDAMTVVDELVKLDIRIEREQGVIYRSADEIRERLRLDMNEYPEFKNPYGCLDSGKLTNTINNFLSMDLKPAQTVLVKRIIRYSRVVHKRVQLVHRLDCIMTRSSVTSEQYRKLCDKYYSEMEAEILRGRAYRLASNLGCVLINYLREDSLSKRFTPCIDWEKTQANKKALQEYGMPIFRAAVYKRYESAGMADRYSGVKYVVYRRNEAIFQIVWAQCTVKNLDNYKYVHTRPNHVEPPITEENVDKIVYLGNSLQAKLYAITKVYPTYYNLFIRNKECHVYKYRRNYRSGRK